MSISTADTVDEVARLDQLRSYNILDTLTEKDYDDVTFMASLICDVPIALISFIDENRQWFKSHKGLEISETSLEHSFCVHAIELPNQPFIITDSRKDDRFKNNPLVIGDPNVVFYAGIPLVNKQGFGLGTVCIIDKKPRKLTGKQVAGMQILASQVMNLLEMRKSNANLEAAKVQLEKFSTNLEKQVAQRTNELEEKNIDLEKMNKELQSFAYISSHDLQEPLRKIQAFSWRIMEKEQAGLTEKAKDYFTRIQDAAKRMQILINDLLYYSRTSTEDRIFKIVDLNTIIREVKEELKEEFEAKHGIVETNGKCMINVISFQFKQLLQNLFTNALKFSKPNQPSVIKITSRVLSGKEIANKKINTEIEYRQISISDNGIGFDPIYKERIFELFQRLHGVSEYKGTGIGLAIVKKIVENHNGIIVAESEQGKGATFQIYLPV